MFGAKILDGEVLLNNTYVTPCNSLHYRWHLTLEDSGVLLGVKSRIDIGKNPLVLVHVRPYVEIHFSSI